MNDITLFNHPEQMPADAVSAESAIVVRSAAAGHPQKLNIGFQF
ncbi:MAG TPA: hypothetical protein VKJ77_01495 [Caballeronia sp.]|nr:hypothetical protein [Caballeronia sp.]